MQNHGIHGLRPLSPFIPILIHLLNKRLRLRATSSEAKFMSPSHGARVFGVRSCGSHFDSHASFHSSLPLRGLRDEN
ncbi:hypothetical protein MtrunA17_Chr1g0208451 [Medicago truncatula]|uniref:Uncharacterized protein n=1 Tax=Medicago truncatula TaxID=3880 RepID=A0A072W1H0_MEDTR|nr:hypothetical protein MTR_1g108305 [Medicago truncatula]RHN82298.1 hypothetical protein MtrunA17_Chr1g0208451 [Medicago truncatula]